MRRLMGRIRAALAALQGAVAVRDVQFYGGLVMVGSANGRWIIVGAALALHAWITPLLTAALDRRA